MPVVDVATDEKPAAAEAATAPKEGLGDCETAPADEEAPVSKIRKILLKDAASSDCVGKIEKLKQEQAELQKTREALRAALRREQKKRSRLRVKARQLTNEDLLAILLMREPKSDASDARAEKRAGAESSSCASGSAESPMPKKQRHDEDPMEE